MSKVGRLTEINCEYQNYLNFPKKSLFCNSKKVGRSEVYISIPLKALVASRIYLLCTARDYKYMWNQVLLELNSLFEVFVVDWINLFQKKRSENVLACNSWGAAGISLLPSHNKPSRKLPSKHLSSPQSPKKTGSCQTWPHQDRWREDWVSFFYRIFHFFLSLHL